MFNKLWTDQAGAVVSAEMILLATGLVMGVLVGMKSVRDSVVTELADVGQALADVDQSYSYSGVSGHEAASSGAFFIDTTDYCDTSNDSEFNIPGDPESGLRLTGNSKCVMVYDSTNGGGAFGPEDGDGNTLAEGAILP